MIDTEVETSRTNGASASNVSVVQSFKKDTKVEKGTNVKEIGNRNKIKAEAKANRENIRVHGKTY